MTVRTANGDGVLRPVLTAFQHLGSPEAFSCNTCYVRHSLIRSGLAPLSRSTGQLDQR
jgi:hypothetical protein